MPEPKPCPVCGSDRGVHTCAFEWMHEVQRMPPLEDADVGEHIGERAGLGTPQFGHAGRDPNVGRTEHGHLERIVGGDVTLEK